MEAQALKRELYAQLGICLEYPDEGSWALLQDAADRIRSVSGEAGHCLDDFMSRMKRMDLTMRQEHYVRTFDLMAQCPLYLSVHLFGEESFRRAELMAGLKCSYERQGAYAMSELPDHLAVVLKLNAQFVDEEWQELVSMCILPAMVVMIGKLEKNNNPYSYVLKAVQSFMMEMESVHA